jgi:hypothetical protein
VPLFGKSNRSGRDQAAVPPPPQADVDSHEFTLKISYSAKSSDGVRLKAGPGLVPRLHAMLTGYLKGESELVEPLPVSLGSASPFIARLPGAMQWLQYNHKRSAVTRHALVVLESVDAVDLVYETLVCGLLSGETDTAGYPEYNAIVGGVVSHFDEITGDLIVRAVVGWGGKGVRGDTDRNAAGVLAGLFNNIAGDTHAIGTVSLDRPMASPGSGGPSCQHCGFESGLERAFYCPKCGMRMHG